MKSAPQAVPMEISQAVNRRRSRTEAAVRAAREETLLTVSPLKNRMETEAPEAILRTESHRKSRIKAIDIHPEDMIMSKGAFSDILNIMKNIFTFL